MSGSVEHDAGFMERRIGERNKEIMTINYNHDWYRRTLGWATSLGG